MIIVIVLLAAILTLFLLFGIDFEQRSGVLSSITLERALPNAPLGIKRLAVFRKPHHMVENFADAVRGTVVMNEETDGSRTVLVGVGEINHVYLQLMTNTNAVSRDFATCGTYVYLNYADGHQTIYELQPEHHGLALALHTKHFEVVQAANKFDQQEDGTAFLRREICPDRYGTATPRPTINDGRFPGDGGTDGEGSPVVVVPPPLVRVAANTLWPYTGAIVGCATDNCASFEASVFKDSMTLLDCESSQELRGTSINCSADTFIAKIDADSNTARCCPLVTRGLSAGVPEAAQRNNATHVTCSFVPTGFNMMYGVVIHNGAVHKQIDAYCRVVQVPTPSPTRDPALPEDEPIPIITPSPTAPPTLERIDDAFEMPIVNDACNRDTAQHAVPAARNHYKVANPKECAQPCLDINNCNFVEYNAQTSTCAFFKTCPRDPTTGVAVHAKIN